MRKQVNNIHSISSPVKRAATWAEWMQAIGAGCAQVYAESGVICDSLYLSKDRYLYLRGLAGPSLWESPLRVVRVDWLPVGSALVGDANAENLALLTE